MDGWILDGLVVFMDGLAGVGLVRRWSKESKVALGGALAVMFRHPLVILGH